MEIIFGCSVEKPFDVHHGEGGRQISYPQLRRGKESMKMVWSRRRPTDQSQEQLGFIQTLLARVRSSRQIEKILLLELTTDGTLTYVGECWCLILPMYRAGINVNEGRSPQYLISLSRASFVLSLVSVAACL